MPITNTQANHIRRAGQASKALLDWYSVLKQLDVQWAGTPNFDVLINDAAINEVSSFVDGGLTAITLADAEAALSTVKNTIDNAIVALTILANLP